MANKISASERNKIDNAALGLIGQPFEIAVHALMSLFGISRDRAAGSVSRVARQERERKARQ